MKNIPTGGQYSVYRTLFGCYLLIHFLSLLPWGAELFSNRGALSSASASPLLHLFPNVFAVCDRPEFVAGLLILGSLLSVLFAVGCWDRLAALLLWYLWACLLGRNPMISNPALPFIGWLLLLHTILPNAPYGSWAARKRADPGGNWHLPQLAFISAWALMAVGYSYSGYTKLVSPSWLDGSALSYVLHNPLARPTPLTALLLALPPLCLRLLTWTALLLELSFAPLALFRKARPWLWVAMVGMHLGLLTVVSFADLTFAMLLLHLFTFDPMWLPPKNVVGREYIFYDGDCALCHGWVKFVLAEDLRASPFRLSPLQGDSFLSRVSAKGSLRLSGTMVVITEEGYLLTRSAAVLYVLRTLGGLWRLLAAIIGVLPGKFLDWLYDRIANIRKRVFGGSHNLCPLLPAELAQRFDP